MIQRLLKKSKQHFIFLGQRGSGKSYWLNHVFDKKGSLYIDLLEYNIYKRLLKNPDELESLIEANPKKKWIIIDEIQKIPALLNTVHRLIEQKKYKFALTGSSARKLKRGKSNLLAGRAFFYKMFTLTWLEAKTKVSFDQYLFWGGLPRLLELKSNQDKKEYLNSYTQLYIKEEIQQEQLIRKIDPFITFLDVAAQMNGKILNFNKIASDTNVDSKTIVSYYQILEETMLGFYLPAFDTSIRKRQKKSPKFYFFDSGIVRALSGQLSDPLKEQTADYGHIFENFIISEIIKLNSYFKYDYKFSFFTSDHGEIDLIIEKGKSKTYLIEIKSKKSITESDGRNIFRYLGDFHQGQGFVFSSDPVELKIKNVHFCHWETGLKKLFKYPSEN